MPYDYKKCFDYIDDYWSKSTFKFKKDSGFHLGLPNPFVAPNHIKFDKDQFYWDSYFIILGLVDSGKEKLAEGMINNFEYLFNKMGFIPSRNRYYNTLISQAPFLTSMILEVFEKTKDKKWLKRVSVTAENELKGYWQYSEEKWKAHLVYKGLSRYCDRYSSNTVSEHESGWDMTSRFGGKCKDFLPVDLNSCLYKYERDLEHIHDILGNKKKSKNFSKLAEKRKRVMRSLMWNRNKGFFFDYNYKDVKQSNFYSLAGFFPLWAGLATKKQSKETVKELKKFEYTGGLAATQKKRLIGIRQWDYPNGWAPLHWIVVKGLLNYGFRDDAERIGFKWLDMNRKVFLDTGKFWEKYDVVKGDVGNRGRYPVETGFGWTNGVFLRIYNELD